MFVSSILFYFCGNGLISEDGKSFHAQGSGLTSWNAIMKIFAADLSFSEIMLGVEGQKFLHQ